MHQFLFNAVNPSPPAKAQAPATMEITRPCCFLFISIETLEPLSSPRNIPEELESRPPLDHSTLPVTSDTVRFNADLLFLTRNFHEPRTPNAERNIPTLSGTRITRLSNSIKQDSAVNPVLPSSFSACPTGLLPGSTRPVQVAHSSRIARVELAGGLVSG